MADRKADQLAGKGSFLDRLRRRRLAIEEGRPEDAAKDFAEDPAAGDSAEADETDVLKKKRRARLAIQ